MKIFAQNFAHILVGHDQIWSSRVQPKTGNKKGGEQVMGLFQIKKEWWNTTDANHTYVKTKLAGRCG